MVSFCDFFFAKQKLNKEVFVKQEKAPIAPRFEGVTVYWSRICPCFGKSQHLGIFGQLPVAKGVKRYIFTQRPFLWTYSHISTTCNHMLQRNSLEKLMFRKTAVSKTFRKFRVIFGQLPVTQCGLNCQKAYPGCVQNFHGRFPGLFQDFLDRFPGLFIVNS